METPKPHGDGWQPIATAPRDREVYLAAYVTPSEAAKANGARAIWSCGVGRWLFGDHWSGVLSANPQWWREA